MLSKKIDFPTGASPLNDMIECVRSDAHKAARELPFVPRLSTDQALAATVDWYKTWIAGGDMRDFTMLQIKSLGAQDA